MSIGTRVRARREPVVGAEDVGSLAFSLVVPLHDEASRFQEFGQRLVDFVSGVADGELVFVDDGSTDSTPALVDALVAANPRPTVRLLRRAHLGKGAAVAAGLAASRGRYAAFCDLDLATPLDQLQRIVDAAQRADLLAIGSRGLVESELRRRESPVRELLGRAYNRLLQATLTPGIVDTQCGAKAASGRVWAAILPECHEAGYAWDAEAIAVARVLDIPVHEIPIVWEHDERSKVRVLRDGAAMVAATPRIWRNAARVRRAARPRAAGEVFDAAKALLLSGSDTDHWWFRSKAALVATAVRRVPPRGGSACWLADLGAGSGGVTSMLGWDPNELLVVDGNETLVRRARSRHGLNAVQGHLSRLPLPEATIDVVCLLDVLEHLEDPAVALGEARRVLRPGGRLIVNVPAYAWLWTEVDDFLGHARRYTRPLLRSQLAAAGLEVRLLSHVFSWLVAPMWWKRRLGRRTHPELGLDQASPAISRLAMVFTLVERELLGRVPVPFGTSILGVAEKPDRFEGERTPGPDRT